MYYSNVEILYIGNQMFETNKSLFVTTALRSANRKGEFTSILDFTHGRGNDGHQVTVDTTAHEIDVITSKRFIK